MKFFLDENINQQLAASLGGMFQRHEFVGVRDLQTKGLEDTDLFPVVADAGCDALITHDLNQLRRGRERLACREAGLHWLGVHQVNAPGYQSLAGPASTIVHALPFIFTELSDAPPPRYFVLKKSERNNTRVFQQRGEL